MRKEIQLGMRDGWGGVQPFGISTSDSRQHLFVIGKSGSGKTTMLRNIAVQLLESGDGVGLIDPHGDVTEELLDYLPPFRADDLVYFNPADLQFPIGLNLLADVAPDARHLVASGIVSSFKSIWRDSWGPRMEYILTNSLMALLECQNVSLLGVNRLLTDCRYRGWVLKQVRDPMVRSFWLGEFAQYDPRFLREAIAPIQNKLGAFLVSPPIRNILGQVNSKIDFQFMMDNRRLFLANLSKGQLGEEPANLLGSLLTTQFQVAALRRAAMPEERRRDFFLIIDEFHNLTTDAFAKMLSEVRKYRLCLILSCQFVEQLSEVVRASVFGNVGTVIAFRVGHSDAEILEHEFGNAFPIGQFVDLDRFQVAVKLLEDGANRSPFLGQSLPPGGRRYGRKATLINHSRQKYATKREVVEDKINRWMGVIK
jgi:Type IV secretion-system coupling protein DNA-binding domain